MIIYYHCTRDSALLLSFLLTCHPYILPLSFHEMIFILVYFIFAVHNYHACFSFLRKSEKIQDNNYCPKKFIWMIGCIFENLCER